MAAPNCGGPRIQGDIYNMQVFCDGAGIEWSVGGLTGFPGTTTFYYQFMIQFKAAGTSGFVSKGTWRAGPFTTTPGGSHLGFVRGGYPGMWVECGDGIYQVDALAVSADGNIDSGIQTKVVSCG